MEIKVSPKMLNGTVAVSEDYSINDVVSVAPFIVASAIGNIVRVSGLNKSGTKGEAKIYSLISGIVSKGSTLKMQGFDRILPCMAVLAANASGITVFEGLADGELAACTEKIINALGGKAKAENGNVEVTGTFGLKGGEVNAFNNADIAAAAVIAGTVSEKPVIVKDCEILEKRHPEFLAKVKELGGDIE